MNWSYEGATGPENWGENYTAANGNYQSPIDIQEDRIKLSYSKKKLKINYDAEDVTILRNTGYFWQTTGEDISSEISGGPLTGNYQLLQIHAHWREPDEKGSEHSVNGQLYDSEIHIVHWNKSKYNSPEEAVNYPDGLCVLGVFLKVGNANPEIQKIVNCIRDITHKGDEAKLKKPINVNNLLPNNKSYWTYNGSLTTPPCLECVIWILFNEPVEISKEQLESFRVLRSHKFAVEDSSCLTLCCNNKVLKNSRPCYPLGERVVFCSADDKQ